MKPAFLAAAALSLFPAAASAVVTVKVNPGTYRWNGQDQVVSWEVYAENSDPNEIEQLNAFTLEMTLIQWTPGGIRFVIPPPDQRGWIPFQRPTGVGSTFAGTYTFESTAPDSAPAGGQGLYYNPDGRPRPHGPRRRLRRPPAAAPAPPWHTSADGLMRSSRPIKAPPSCGR
jgi:hypothetical protein